VYSVDTVLKMCGLEKYADAVVGSLSVEHRKRTTIGVELAAKVRNEVPIPKLSGIDTLKAEIAPLFRRTYVWA
jgi:ATP-binding cassette subfamily G (WHITE) protein 2 (SNQ2)